MSESTLTRVKLAIQSILLYDLRDPPIPARYDEYNSSAGDTEAEGSRDR